MAILVVNALSHGLEDEEAEEEIEEVEGEIEVVEVEEETEVDEEGVVAEMMKKSNV